MRYFPLVLLPILSIGCSSHSKKLGAPHGPACEKIEATRAKEFAMDRAQTLLEIARGDDLSAHEQQHLIEYTLESWSYSDDRLQVLLAVAGRSGLDRQARETLKKRINEVPFESNRRRILQALAKHD